MMLDKHTRRARQHVRVLVVGVVVVIVLALAQIWLWKFVHSMAVRLHETRSLEQQIAEVKSRYDEIDRDYRSQQMSLDELAVIVPSSADVLPIIEQLEKLAQEAGVVVDVSGINDESVKPLSGSSSASRVASIPIQLGRTGDGLRASNIVALSVSLKIVAEPIALLRYLDAVEHLPQLTQVSSLIMNPHSEQEASNDQELPARYDLDMDVIFYVQEDGNAP